MLRSLACAVAGLLIGAAGLLAFEVRATIKKIDPDKGLVVFTANQQDRTLKIPGDVKILDADGKELAGGLRASGLKEGAEVTLTVERVNG